jgi:ATP-dependent Clp protease ATP-binding subunit ClpA
MHERFTDTVKQVLHNACQEAEAYVAPVHVLLGLATQTESLASAILIKWGVTAQQVRQMIVRDGDQPGPASNRTPMTPSSYKLLEDALCTSIRMAHDTIRTEHLLYALTMSGNSMVSKFLSELGLDRSELQAEIERRINSSGYRIEP